MAGTPALMLREPRTMVRLVIVLLVTACAVRPAPDGRPLYSVPIIVPTLLPNGEVDVTVMAGYTLGKPASIPIAVMATRGTITGPVVGRVVASGFGENGAPSELVVRRLAVSPVAATAGQRRSTEVVWDGRDERGIIVPGDAYSLVLEFRVEDAGSATTATVGATLQWNP